MPAQPLPDGLAEPLQINQVLQVKINSAPIQGDIFMNEYIPKTSYRCQGAGEIRLQDSKFPY